MVQGTFQASIAAVMHEDVRYIASAHKGLKERALHAITYSFLTYNNQGHAVVNIANLSSFYAATAISTTWLPGRSRGGEVYPVRRDHADWTIDPPKSVTRVLARYSLQTPPPP
jgi:hypothetical protein